MHKAFAEVEKNFRGAGLDGAAVRPPFGVLTGDHASGLNGRTMRTADIMTDKLTAAFTPVSLTIEDESHRHEGHAGHRPGGQTHFRVSIVAEAFRGKSRLERHRMINDALAEEIKGGIHALAIQASAPGETG
jgi:BolA family transcriptional regulator, general stress-responsive regulator